MDVSVIIPVHNAEAYIAEAIQSALLQPETREVIVVDDGSTDQSAAIGRKMADKDRRVRVVTHRDGRNHGVSAARNLGIQSAAGAYIAFLDSDDFYLPDRFAVAGQLFLDDSSAEGVCEAIGVHFESPEAEAAWKRSGYPMLTTIRAEVDPDRIFESQSPIGKSGHCSLDGLTVKRTALQRTGLFDPELAMGEDTAFFAKLAVCAVLRLGKVDAPVAMRRIHSSNTITRPRSSSRKWRDRLSMWLVLYRWFRSRRPVDSRRRLIVKRMLEEAQGMAPVEGGDITRTFRFMRRWMGAVARCPRLLGDPFFWREAAKQTAQCFQTGQKTE